MGLFDVFKKKKKEVQEPAPDANGQIPVTPAGVQNVNPIVTDPNAISPIPSTQPPIDPNLGLAPIDNSIANQVQETGTVIPAPTNAPEVSIPNSFTDITNGGTVPPVQNNFEVNQNINNQNVNGINNDFSSGTIANVNNDVPSLPSGFADAVDNNNSMNTTINNSEPTAVDNMTPEQEINASTDIVPSVEDTAALIDNPIPAKSEEENMSVDLSQVVGEPETNNNDFKWESNPFQEEPSNEEKIVPEETNKDEVGPEIDIEDVEEKTNVEEENKEDIDNQTTEDSEEEMNNSAADLIEETPEEKEETKEEETKEEESTSEEEDLDKEDADLHSSLDEVLSKIEKEVSKEKDLDKEETDIEEDDDENDDEVKTIEDEDDKEENDIEEDEEETEEESDEEEKEKPILVEEEESDIFSLPRIGNEVYPDIFKQPTLVYDEEDTSDEDDEEDSIKGPVLEEDSPFSIFDLPPLNEEKEEPKEEVIEIADEPVKEIEIEEVTDEPIIEDDEESENNLDETVNMEDIFRKLDFKNEKIRFCENCGAMIYGNSATVCPSCGEPL